MLGMAPVEAATRASRAPGIRNGRSEAPGSGAAAAQGSGLQEAVWLRSMDYGRCRGG
eukprot:CAMPEP_0176122340 /NCGR_PEP_ID=MMETSP0120_2-20121206/61613_1 /TAXON_ID=160619 /ORGANISM="Kryptoperidinium foliaceum, Strain CCMP 1326" /LENGTH=56 /DNA_ID=CAMNT_0017456959 /DNA_START=1 /DNA_END=167 /DNA_ORIENTATION=+